MIAYLAIRKSAWAAATSRQRELARVVLSFVRVGVPASWADGTNEWWVSGDHRFSLQDCAYLSTFFANIASVPPSYDPDEHTEAENRIAARNFCQNNGLVWPVEIPEEDPNPWQTVRAANNAPVWFQMNGFIPDIWSPTQEEAA